MENVMEMLLLEDTGFAGIRKTSRVCRTLMNIIKKDDGQQQLLCQQKLGIN